MADDLRPLLVSVKKARELLGGCGNNRIWKLIKDGELEVVGSERKRWVVVESLNSYVERQRAAAKSNHDAVTAKPTSKQAGVAHV